MKKSVRHELIKELVSDNKIQNQEMFVKLLSERGVEVTQATISRDINELDLLKVSHADGGYHYSLNDKDTASGKLRLTKMLSQSAVKVDVMDKYLSIKTIPGSAVALGLLLEQSLINVLFTSLTTDDKVLLIFKNENTATVVAEKLKEEISK